MRVIVEPQLRLSESWIDHRHARELCEIGAVLDERCELAALIHADLVTGRSSKRGRRGLSGEQVLRILVLKQLTGFSYDKLAFHLADSRSYRAFCRLGIGADTPRKSALQSSLSKVLPETLETVGRALVRSTTDAQLEPASRVRIDTTVTASHIHHPTDSSLLFDSIRVLTRLIRRAVRAFEVPLLFANHTKAAKRRAYQINQARRKAKRVKPYRELVRFCEKVVRAGRRMTAKLRDLGDQKAAEAADRIMHFAGLAERVIEQTRRRIFEGEVVPARQKVVSIFEEHTDVINKGGRDVEYGHKLCLAVGESMLVLDCMIEDGAPNDCTLTVPAVERVAEIIGRVPHAVAFDGGFSSVEALRGVKELGVREVMFHRKGWLTDTSLMTSTPEIHRALWCFRAGVEGCVSFLKRCFGLRTALWRGRAGFERFVRASILAANLLTIARLRLHAA